MNGVMLFSTLKSFLVLLLLFFIDIGPVPITAMIGLYIVWFRPKWFKALIDNIYSDDN